MESPKILYVSQEIAPYLPDSPVSVLGRYLPQGILDAGKEIRTFMPRFGCVNERRNQLHEVIRLSGLNIVIDDVDHPLIIKVASIQAARMQIYFIDNDDFFTRKGTHVDVKSGEIYPDNDERSIFFARGVLETTKKLRWVPDIIHLQGWFTVMVAVFRRFLMQDDPYFQNAKIVLSLFDEEWEGQWSDVQRELWVEGIDTKGIDSLDIHDYQSLMFAAIDLADGICIASDKVSQPLVDYARKSGKPVMDFPGSENFIPAYNDFYDKILAL